jgi:hypothetical protein
MSASTGITPARPTLQQFSLDDLAVYTAEQAFGPTASPDFRVFYVGRDDVHGVLMHLFTRVTLSVKMNMFGYDDYTNPYEIAKFAARLDYEHAVAASQRQPVLAVAAAS